MKKLRLFYYFYLVLLPVLALPSRVVTEAEAVAGWWYIFLFLGVIVYLDVVVELIPFPKTWPQVLVTTFSVPVQLTFAFVGNENIWLIFTYQFLVEAAGALIGLVFYSLSKSQFEIKKIVTILVLLLLPATAVIKIFGAIVSDTVWEWRSVFLATALLSATITNLKRLKGGRNEDDLWPLIIVGVFAFIIGGPFLLALVK